MGVVRKSLILIISKTVTAATTLIGLMIVSRLLEINDFSYFKQIQTMNTLVLTFLTIGIPSSVLYFVSPKNKEAISNVIASMVLLLLLFLIVFYPIINLFNNYFNTNIFTEYIVIIFLINIFSIINSINENLFLTTNALKFIFWGTVLPNILYIILLSTIMVEGVNSLKLVLMFFLLREVLKVLFLMVFMISNRINIHDINFRDIKKILFFGIPIGVSAVIGVININIDKLIVGRLLSVEKFAVISNASYELPILGIISISVFNVILPKIKENYNSGKFREIAVMWKKIGCTMITIVIPLTTVSILYSKEIITLIFSEKYIDAAPIFAIYQLNAFSRIYLYGSFFLAVGRSKQYMANSIITLLLNLVLSLVLVQFAGLIGVAIATVLSNTIIVFYQNYYIKKILRTKIRDFFPLKQLLSSIIISFIIIYCIRYIYIHIIGESIFIGIIVACFSLLLMIFILSNYISKDLIWILKKRFKRVGDKDAY